MVAVLVAAVILVAVLGNVATPALIGGVIVGGVAAYRGLPGTRAAGLGAAVFGVLLLCVLILAYLLGTTARIEVRSSGASDGARRPIPVSTAAPTRFP